MMKKIIASTCLFLLLFALLLIYLITGKPSLGQNNICPLLCPVEEVVNTPEDNNNSDIDIWQLPESTAQGYPKVDKNNNDLYIYNFNTNSATNTTLKSAWGQGAIY